MKRPQTVAMDGSECAVAAARWAAAHAVRTGGRVRLLHVRQEPGQGREMTLARWNDLELNALDAMTRTAAELRAAHPGLEVDTETLSGDVALSLRRVADRAGTLVLGTRGAGLAAAVLGSVALSVASHAESPVVLLPLDASHTPPDREIVAGIDLRGDCGPVLFHGLEEARSHGVRLNALHVWQGLNSLASVVHSRPPLGRRRGEERMVSTELAGAHAYFPDVEAVTEEVQGDPAEALPEAGEKASLLVLGRRRHRPVSALGPVVLATLRAGTCPVAVVPHW